MSGPEINFPPLSKQKWLEMVASDFNRIGRPFEQRWRIDESLAVERIRTSADRAGYLPIPGITNGPYGILLESSLPSSSAHDATTRRARYKPVPIHRTDDMAAGPVQIKLTRAGSLLAPASADLAGATQDDTDLSAHFQKYTSSTNVLFVAEAAKSGDSHSSHLADTFTRYALLLDRLVNSGLSISEMYDRIAVVIRLSSEFLTELCKIRALRIGMCQILLDFGCEPNAVDKTIIWAGSDVQPDPDDYSYLIHQTESFSAAILGGCNSVIVEDHADCQLTLGIPRLLAHESHLGDAGDVCFGSYQLEHMTDELLSAAWEMFLTATESVPTKPILQDCQTS